MRLSSNFILFSLALCLLWALPASAGQPAAPVGALMPCEYLRATDGDTIKVALAGADGGGAAQVRVRLTGIDAPEITDGTAAGFAAAAHLAQACEDAVKLYLEVDDAKPTDRYGRTLAWVWAEDAKGQRTLLNALMVDDGFALIYPSDEAKRYFSWGVADGTH